MEVLATDEVECVEVTRRRIALLGPRDVEPDDALVAMADGALGDLDRSRGLAHRGHEHLHDDGPAGLGGPRRPTAEPLEVRGDHLVEG